MIQGRRTIFHAWQLKWKKLYIEKIRNNVKTDDAIRIEKIKKKKMKKKRMDIIRDRDRVEMIFLSRNTASWFFHSSQVRRKF